VKQCKVRQNTPKLKNNLPCESKLRHAGDAAAVGINGGDLPGVHHSLKCRSFGVLLWEWGGECECEFEFEYGCACVCEWCCGDVERWERESVVVEHDETW
jgi:hypothetical protein